MGIERWLYTMPLRLRSLFRRRQVEQELDEEFQYHVERKTDQYIAQGLDPEAARRYAIRDMDGIGRRKEECRDMRGMNVIQDLVQDLRYGLRTLLKDRSFSAVALLILALGIGANTAIYSAVDSTLLRRLPFQDPDRLMKVSLTTPSMYGDPPRTDMVWSYPKYETFSQLQRVFEDTAVYQSHAFNLSGDGEPEQVRGEIVGASYFRVLGEQPEVGRTFLPEEDRTAGTHFVVILSGPLWRRRFAGSPQVLGRTVRIDLKNYTIVGVMPAGFQPLSGQADVWIPAHTLDADELGERWNHSWDVIARLKRGVSVEQAKRAAVALGQQVDAAHPGHFKGWGAIARTLNEVRVDPVVRKSILVLFAAVGLVLLIACVNIANLLLARSTSREREIAIRLAVGAERWRLVRQLLVESVLLAFAGALLSVAVTFSGVRLLAAINPANGGSFARIRISGLTQIGLSSIHLDSRALLFTFGIALITGVIFGLLPAIAASNPDLTSALKSTSASKTGHAAFRLLTGKSILVVAEFALAFMLLVSAGLMMKSFGRLLATRVGVDPEDVLSLRIDVPSSNQDRDVETPFFEQLENGIRSLPGVLSAGMSNCYPLAGGCNGTLIWFRDRPEVPSGTEPTVGVHFVSPEYFKTLKIPLLRGRWFEPTDRKGKTKVVLISEAAAKKFWPGQDPIGRPIGVGQGGFGDRAEIIGIVGDVRYGEMDEPPIPDVYISYLQSPRSSLMIFVRATTSPAALIPAVRRQVHELNKDLPVYDIQLLPNRMAASTARARFSATLLAVFALLALALAAIGIYGVMSYVVAQRTHEIGVRMALGAEPGNVRWLMLARGATLALAGVVIGILGSLASTRVLASLLYQVKPGDPSTYAVISAVLGVAALVAIYVPARRATRVDPMVALRAE